jgi:Zn-dependent protease
VAGITVYMHVTFLMLLAWVGISHYAEHHRVAEAWAGIGFMLALFGIVVLHELGHALTARHYGIRTRDITLLPIGGVARLERMPDDPKQELLVALAGPAVNMGLAAILYAILMPGGALAAWRDVQVVGGSFLSKLLWVNVSLAGFNLIPAFPMDGGRMLRALLAMRMDYVRATQVAAHLGQGLAVLFGVVGLFTNPFLVFIALFVWTGAAAEASLVLLKSALGGIPVSRAMITEFQTLAPTETLQHALDHVLAGSQHDFPVVEGGQVVGVLTRGDLMKGLAETGPEGRVAAAMTLRFETADPSDMLEGAFQRLQATPCRALPVLRDGQLVGILTMENVGEFLMIQSALRSGHGSTPMRGG